MDEQEIVIKPIEEKKANYLEASPKALKFAQNMQKSSKKAPKKRQRKVIGQNKAPTNTVATPPFPVEMSADDILNEADYFIKMEEEKELRDKMQKEYEKQKLLAEQDRLLKLKKEMETQSKSQLVVESGENDLVSMPSIVEDYPPKRCPKCNKKLKKGKIKKEGRIFIQKCHCKRRKCLFEQTYRYII